MKLKLTDFCDEQDVITIDHDGQCVILELTEDMTRKDKPPMTATAFLMPPQARVLARVLADALLRFADDCEAAGREEDHG